MRHDVTLLTYATSADEENVAELERQGIHVETVRQEAPSTAERRTAQLRSLLGRTPYEPHRTYSREMQEAIDRLFASDPFDVVQLESTLVWPFRFPAGTPLVLDEHNVDYETYARMREGTSSPIRKAFYLVEEGASPEVRAGRLASLFGARAHVGPRGGDGQGGRARHGDRGRAERRRHRVLHA